jgi:hypothetical protein
VAWVRSPGPRPPPSPSEPGFTQNREILLDQPAEPGKQRSYAVEDPPLRVFFFSSLLCIAETLVDRLRQFGMLVKQLVS